MAGIQTAGNALRTKITKRSMRKVIRYLATFSLLCTVSTRLLAQWNYSNFPDPYTGQTLRLASIESSGWQGKLLVRMLPEGTVSVAFGVPATIMCSNPCTVYARLDGIDGSQRDVRYPGNQTNMLFFSPQTLPFAKIRKSSKLEVEIQTREFGWRVLTFDVSGFDIDRLNVGK